MTFGEKLKILRESKSLTQEQLSEKLQQRYSAGCSRVDIAGWEIGRHHPKWPAAVAISKFFKVSLDDLFYEEREKMFRKIK